MVDQIRPSGLDSASSFVRSAAVCLHLVVAVAVYSHVGLC